MAFHHANNDEPKDPSPSFFSTRKVPPTIIGVLFERRCKPIWLREGDPMAWQRLMVQRWWVAGRFTGTERYYIRHCDPNKNKITIKSETRKMRQETKKAEMGDKTLVHVQNTFFVLRSKAKARIYFVNFWSPFHVARDT
jgi:hypothetical protein